MMLYIVGVKTKHKILDGGRRISEDLTAFFEPRNCDSDVLL